jgi:hypothetical protein
MLLDSDRPTKKIMKRIIFIILLTLAATILQAQSLNFKWAKQMGGAGCGSGYSSRSVTTDKAGNVYTTGYFNGIVDFDPGPGTFNLTAGGNPDRFISKLDAAGNFIWARQMGGHNSLDCFWGFNCFGSPEIFIPQELCRYS